MSSADVKNDDLLHSLLNIDPQSAIRDPPHPTPLSLQVTSSLASNTSSVEEDNKLNLSVVIADMMHLMSHVREVLFLTSGRCEDEKNAVDAQARKDSHARRTGAILTECTSWRRMHCGDGEGEVATQRWEEQVERRN